MGVQVVKYCKVCGRHQQHLMMGDGVFQCVVCNPVTRVKGKIL